MYVYTASKGFRAVPARAGTVTSQTRPLTLNGADVQRFTLNDTESATYLALTSDAERRKFLATVERHTALPNGKVVVSKAALDDFISRMKIAHPATAILDAEGNATGRVSYTDAVNAVKVAYASGIVALDVITEDKTESVVASLFPDEDAPEEEEPTEENTAPPAKATK